MHVTYLYSVYMSHMLFTASEAEKVAVVKGAEAEVVEVIMSCN